MATEILTTASNMVTAFGKERLIAGISYIITTFV